MAKLARVPLFRSGVAERRFRVKPSRNGEGLTSVTKVGAVLGHPEEEGNETRSSAVVRRDRGRGRSARNHGVARHSPTGSAIREPERDRGAQGAVAGLGQPQRGAAEGIRREPPGGVENGSSRF